MFNNDIHSTEPFRGGQPINLTDDNDDDGNNDDKSDTGQELILKRKLALCLAMIFE